MIYLDVTGRCGNQFFQYAFMRKIQLENKRHSEEVYINFYNVYRWRKKTNDDSFSDQLCHFNVIKYKAINCEDNLISVYGTKKQKNVFKKYHLFKSASEKLHIPLFAKFWHKKMQKFGIFYEDKFFKVFNKTKKGCDIFIKGYFEDALYYSNLVETLKCEFASLEKMVSNRDLVSKLSENKSVCISIRVWDELGREDLILSREVCDYNYYFNAYIKMKALVPDSLFIVFSNNIEKVKENYPFLKGCLFEPKNLEIWEKVSLMSTCKHYILSTSTFSWWISFLGKKTDTIIISPTKWYNDKNDNRLLTSEMIKV